MNTELNLENGKIKFETLDSFISKKETYPISNKAMFTGFKHRTKVEFLKFFIV